MRQTLLDSTLVAILFYLLAYSIFVHYKNEVINERIEFLNHQKEDLKTQCEVLLFTLKKYKNYKNQIRTKFLQKVEAHTLKLLNFEKEVDLEEMVALNHFYQREFDFEVGVALEEFKALSEHIVTDINEYIRLKFALELLRKSGYLYVPFYSDLIVSEFKLVEYWSRGKYHVDLDYNSDLHTESMHVDKMDNESDEFIFTPTKSGIHHIPIYLSILDMEGNESLLEVNKTIEVLP